MTLSLPWVIALVSVLVCAVALCLVVPIVIRERRFKAIRDSTFEPEVVEVEGVGTFHVFPMSAAMQTALFAVQQSTPNLALYSWMIAECVRECQGMSAHKISMEFAPKAIEQMGDAVLRVSGLTEQGREETEKKS